MDTKWCNCNTEISDSVTIMSGKDVYMSSCSLTIQNYFQVQSIVPCHVKYYPEPENRYGDQISCTTNSVIMIYYSQPAILILLIITHACDYKMNIVQSRLSWLLVHSTIATLVTNYQALVLGKAILITESKRFNNI